ncbi:SDR family NAD(P)-dependent oxidoreductase [Streptomyces sp. NPDC054784]
MSGGAGPATDLAGCNVLVTGGSTGIGRAAAEACLQAGARVVVCARTGADVTAAVADMRERHGDRVHGMAADVTRIQDVEAVLDLLEQRYGPVHGLVHAAAVLGPIGPLSTTDPDAWFDAVRTNLFGTYLTVRQTCRRMETGTGGRIALFAGGGAAAPFPRYTSYASAKAAVVRLTETVAVESAEHGIEINCIAPGFVATRMHRDTLAAGDEAGADYLARTKALLSGEGGVAPEVGGEAAAFLVSAAAQGITGKFVAAPYDGWRTWHHHLESLRDTDIYTLRRILPTERGEDWR